MALADPDAVNAGIATAAHDPNGFCEMLSGHCNFSNCLDLTNRFVCCLGPFSDRLWFVDAGGVYVSSVSVLWLDETRFCRLAGSSGARGRREPTTGRLGGTAKVMETGRLRCRV